jgi:galactose mutarotase-like enzyme
MSVDRHVFRSEGLVASVLAQGAELCSLKNDGGRELIWQAGPEWPRHAPLLFPIVGRLKNDELRHRGKSYGMTQHGFARDLRFEWLARDAHRCKLLLSDDEVTRTRYPFAFRLEVTYTAKANGLEVAFDLINTGEDTLPASLGGHPCLQLAAAARAAKGSLPTHVLQ